MTERAWTVVLAIALGVASSGIAAPPGLHVEVSPRDVPLSGELRVVLTVSGDGAGNALLESRPPGRGVIAGSRATSQRIDDGEAGAAKVFVLTYLPYAVGPGEVPSFVIIVNDEQHRTDPVPVTVTGGPSPPPGVPGHRSDGPDRVPVRVLATLDPARVFQGQETLLRYRMIFRTRIARTPRPLHLPTLPGFVIEDRDPPRDARTVIVEGETWREVVLAERRLRPTRPGLLTIDPTLLRIQVESPGTRRRGTIGVDRVVPPLGLEVMPPPADGRPADFSGAVGSFTLEAALDTEDVSSGEAVRLSVRVMGEGPLETAAAPRIAVEGAARVLPPESRSDDGERRWIFPVLAEGGDRVVLRPSWSYFDPDAEAYRRLEAPGLAVLVRRSGPATRMPVRPLADDIRFIKPVPAALADRADDHYRRPWFWAVVAVPVLALGAAVLRRRR